MGFVCILLAIVIRVLSYVHIIITTLMDSLSHVYERTLLI